MLGQAVHLLSKYRVKDRSRSHMLIPLMIRVSSNIRTQPHLPVLANRGFVNQKTAASARQYGLGIPNSPARAALLRQKSIRDNQSHHARENQQGRKGFSDRWPRRMARSQSSGLRFRPSLKPHDFALCRCAASLRFRRHARASHLAVISAVDLANGQGGGLVSLIVSSRVR